MAKKVKLTRVQEKTNELLDKMDISELLENQMKINQLKEHTLFIAPPQSVDDSYRFGWMRGIAFMTDTFLGSRWYNWLAANVKGEVNPDNFQETSVTRDLGRGSMGYKMLEKCMTILSRRGYRVTDFIEWIGYALGIAWFEKPRIPNDVWKELYENFNLDIFYMEPADYLSHFVSEYGQSGHLDYFPTPMHVTDLINRILHTDDNEDITLSQFEPCIGGAAMLLPSKSLNLVGADLSLTMVKVSAIQAFIYKPWMLYVPKPLVGLHVDKETMTINRYFEFDTETRIYCGDSLLGEYRAPAHIFEEGSKWVDVYLHALDLSKREIFKYEEEMLMDWETLSHETKIKIVKAQAREIGFETMTTNPPFNAKLNKHASAQMRIIEGENQVFLEERAKRLEKYERSHALVNAVIQEVELKISEEKSKRVIEGQLELIF